MVVLQKMLVLFLIMLVGYEASKKQLLTKEVSQKLSGIIINIANPCMILSSVLDGDLKSIQTSSIWFVLLLAWIVYAILMLIAEIVPRLLRVPQKDFGMYRMMTVFTNMGYMGFPIIKSIYGNAALLYASLFMIPFDFLIYTYGIIVIKKDGWRQGVKVRELCNNGVIACVLMIILLFSGIRVPQILSDSINTIADMTVPVSMMIIGASMAEINLSELFCDIKLLVFSFMHLIIIPIIVILPIMKIITQPEIIGITLVVIATPVGSLAAMMAQEYGGDYRLASKGVAITTLLSVGTIPLVFAVLGL